MQDMLGLDLQCNKEYDILNIINNNLLFYVTLDNYLHCTYIWIFLIYQLIIHYKYTIIYHK